MKKVGKLCLMAMLVFSLFACGRKNDQVNITKEGQEYTVNDDVSFYYPKEFALQTGTTQDDASSLNFVYENQKFYYYVEYSAYDNETTDMDELYHGELSQMGAASIEIKKPVLESGLDCYEYSGEFSDTGLKFTNLVYFEDQTTYVYGYQATADDYDDNIDRMTVFLESFSKAAGKIE